MSLISVIFAPVNANAPPLLNSTGPNRLKEASSLCSRLASGPWRMASKVQKQARGQFSVHQGD